MFAIVFPGQGSQRVGMGADFAERFPEARAVLDEADEAFGDALSRWMAEGPPERLASTEITQPAVLAASIAIHRVVQARIPAEPVRLAGHSLGEYTALVAAGALALGDAVHLVRRRGALMQQAVPAGDGAMAAVLGLDAGVVEEVCATVDGTVSPANYNAPGQTVVAGSAEAVEAAIAALRERGARAVRRLQVSAPFHCELMAPARDPLVPILESTPFRDPTLPVVSNVTGEAYTTAAEARELLLRQVCAPVRWVACVAALRDAGARLQLELGPGRVLSGLIPRNDASLARANVATVDDLPGALKAVEEAAA